MISAYNIGLVLGALASALVISRILSWLSRKRLAGWIRVVFPNAVAFAIIVAVSVFVRSGIEWDAVLLHLIAQAVWLAIDLALERRAA